MTAQSSQLPILSEYESVNDSLLLCVEKNFKKNKNKLKKEEEGGEQVVRCLDESFEMTISAFDKLSSRCDLLESSLVLEDDIKLGKVLLRQILDQFNLYLQ